MTNPNATAREACRTCGGTRVVPTVDIGGSIAGNEECPDCEASDREAILAEFEADEQLAADLLAEEEAAAARFDDEHRFEPRWAFLP